MTNFEILDLSNYDPEIDIVIVYVNVGKLPPQRIIKHMEKAKEQVKPLFDARKFESLFIPVSDGTPVAIVDIVTKTKETLHEQVSNYDDAKKFVGDQK